MLRSANKSLTVSRNGEVMPVPAPWARTSRAAAVSGPVVRYKVRAAVVMVIDYYVNALQPKFRRSDRTKNAVVPMTSKLVLSA